jgi:hypothetical protein
MITLTAEIEINGKVITLNNKRIISISSNIFDRSDITRPSYGIISNTGELKFNDFDSEFLNYANQRLLTSDLPVSIFLNNTLYKIRQQIGKFQTRSWSYDNDNRMVSVSLKDDLEEWQEINVDGITYDPVNSTPQSLYDIYCWLYQKTPAKYELLNPNELNDKTLMILEKTIINYVFMESGNLWKQWNIICEASQSHIYKNNNGRTIFTYKGGN